ncbi:MAG: VanZ family protein [Bacilli bacterium]|jgi:glycopeptide antibiotics resistance protein
MLINNIRMVIEDTWPMIAIASTIIVSIRLVWLYRHKKVIVYHHELLSLLFLWYILILFQVVTFQDVSWSTSNFTPFKEIFRYEIGDRLFYKNVVGNFMMFVPFGFFVSYYLKFKKIYEILLMSLIASTTIEYIQLVIGRVFDVDDIILNLGGALIGYIVYRVIYRV